VLSASVFVRGNICTYACVSIQFIFTHFGRTVELYFTALALSFRDVAGVALEQATVHITPLLLGVSKSILAFVATLVSLLLATIQ